MQYDYVPQVTNKSTITLYTRQVLPMNIQIDTPQVMNKYFTKLHVLKTDINVT